MNLSALVPGFDPYRTPRTPAVFTDAELNAIAVAPQRDRELVAAARIAAWRQRRGGQI